MLVTRIGTDEVTGKALLSLFIVPTDVEGLEKRWPPVAISVPEKQFTLHFDNVRISSPT